VKLDRRIANAVKRVHTQIDEWADDALLHVALAGNKARMEMNDAFTTAARSLGQSRRYRNTKGVST
jgi:hypothetical protein